MPYEKKFISKLHRQFFALKKFIGKKSIVIIIEYKGVSNRFSRIYVYIYYADYISCNLININQISCTNIIMSLRLSRTRNSIICIMHNL